MRAQGCDVSHWEGDIDWRLAAIHPSTEFVFMKATEGINYTDVTFSQNWRGVKEYGRYRSPFHFVAKDEPGRLQAVHFHNTIAEETDTKCDIPPIIDLEDEYGVPHTYYLTIKSAFWAIVDDLIDNTLALFGEKPILYSNQGFMDDMSPPDFLSEFPLWVANTGVPAPHIPQPWRRKGKSWLFWQYIFSLRIPGVNAAVDGNYFLGNSSQLSEYVTKRILPGVYVPELPALASVKYSLFVRKDPGKTLTNDVGKLYPKGGFYPEVVVLQLAPDKYGADRLWGRIGNNVWICVREGGVWYVEWL